LSLKATVTDVIHYCQLGKMAVVTVVELLWQGANPSLPPRWGAGNRNLKALLGMLVFRFCGEEDGLRVPLELRLSKDEHAGSLLEKPILADVMPQHENEDS